MWCLWPLDVVLLPFYFHLIILDTHTCDQRGVLNYLPASGFFENSSWIGNHEATGMADLTSVHCAVISALPESNFLYFSCDWMFLSFSSRTAMLRMKVMSRWTTTVITRKWPSKILSWKLLCLVLVSRFCEGATFPALMAFFGSIIASDSV